MSMQFLKGIYFHMYESFADMCVMCTMWTQYLQRPEEGIASHGPGVAAGYELPFKGCWESRSSERAASAEKSISPAWNHTVCAISSFSVELGKSYPECHLDN